ncbi:hypothetical protein DMH04_25550 [Kibdelosporangium aridum]|uniref:Uncharacterized protein n=1 Tax=Kibdelosporangium aridum TaxID=2030 RepID=A0A428Z651_KIBAR|nr:hypothetical protein [Kibdelosporangium aridum]RSM82560.1 hypothetical protein DMH04_25550 [Kibdelosporangium aridum]
MPRNRYTKFVHQAERARVTQQEARLSAFARELRNICAQDTATPAADSAKQQRRDRIEQKRLHRLRKADAAEQS